MAERSTEIDLGGIHKLVVGLGNPGNEFVGTRHNLGWVALDAFIEHVGVKKDFQRLHKSRIQIVSLGDHIDILLVRPVTYMNLSGTALAYLLQKTDLQIQDVLVIHDDMDLEEGRAKMRFNGGTAGHKGIENIAELCGPDFTRIKIGISTPPDDFHGDGADWVLEKLDASTSETISRIMPRVAEAVSLWALSGVEKAMTWFNSEMRGAGEDSHDASGAEPGDEGRAEVCEEENDK
jgi:PTH1 family peptidyl-tRNA hydrolase